MIKIQFVDGKEPIEIEADTLKDAVEKAIKIAMETNGQLMYSEA